MNIDKTDRVRQMKVLIGSTFPLGLIRAEVTIIPCSTESLISILSDADIYSFWGHSNTLHIANQLLGIDLTPKTERPVLSLSSNSLPMLDGIEFSECWVLSPDYILDFRPKIGTEIASDQISGWQVLKITWGAAE
jgi:hypothetical protein